MHESVIQILVFIQCLVQSIQTPVFKYNVHVISQCRIKYDITLKKKIFKLWKNKSRVKLLQSLIICKTLIYLLTYSRKSDELKQGENVYHKLITYKKLRQKSLQVNRETCRWQQAHCGTPHTRLFKTVFYKNKVCIITAEVSCFHS